MMQKENPLKENSGSMYTCKEYREEMIVLALRQKLHNPDLPENERDDLEKELARLEEQIGF